MLLHFSGSTNVCCETHSHGPSIRAAIERLANASQGDPELQLRGVARTHASANLYEAQGLAMARSEFCLVPAGDYEVTSRLYSAIAAGCIPVVVSPGLSGAFASIVNYDRFWLRVHFLSFNKDPTTLVHRLRAMSTAERVRRRTQLLRHAVDVLYDVPGSKVADNFLRMAGYGCLSSHAFAAGVKTQLLGTLSPEHAPNKHSRVLPDANGTEGGDRCTCARRGARYWWSPFSPSSSTSDAIYHNWTYKWDRLVRDGQREEAPSELCGCNLCRLSCEDSCAPQGLQWTCKG